MSRLAAGCALAVALASFATPAQAQPLGTFIWQLQPYCNRVSLSVTQNGDLLTLDGFDDQCGGATRAAVVGTAFPNPDGTIGLGFSIVATPGGNSTHVDAVIDLASASGTWRDSAANTGTFLFNGPGGGSPVRCTRRARHWRFERSSSRCPSFRSPGSPWHRTF